MITYEGLRRALALRIRGPWEKYSGVRRAIWAVLFAVLLALILSPGFIPERLNVVVGEPAPNVIKAPREFVDSVATEGLRQEAAANIPDVYDQDPAINREVESRIQVDFAAIVDLQSKVARNAEVDLEEIVADLEELLDLQLETQEWEDLLELSPAATSRMEDQALELAGAIMGDGIKPDGLEGARERIRQEALRLDYPPHLQEVLGHVVSRSLRPNLFFNPDRTEERRQEAMEAVDPVVVARGVTIVRDGELITQEDLIRLRDAGLLREETDIQGLLGALLVGIFSVLLSGAYLRHFRPHIYRNEAHIVLLGFLVLVVVGATRAIWPVSGYLAPVAVGTMLIAILLDGQVAVFMSAVIAVLVGFLSAEELRYILVAMVGGFTGALAVSRVGQRSDLMKAGFQVGGANALTIVILMLVSGQMHPSDLSMWRDVLVGGANGLISGILTIGSLPYLEGFFGLVTSVKLIELSNPNQPLLRELMVKAPGTYHHSIMVANLAEAAVEEIGGNSLLARVGAYYHDIGKMRRPYFFIENQMSGENPHDKLAPNLSALIITAHVKEGLEMAQEHGLPREITRFIPEHHGTSRVTYFYNRAAEESGEDIMEENFSYEGPKPSTKESAVVMLADAAEAAVRSLTRPTPGRIEAVVRKVIRDRLNDGQLDRADLSLRDLDAVAQAFVRVLTGIFHARIEYPEGISQENGTVKRVENQGKTERPSDKRPGGSERPGEDSRRRPGRS